MRLLIVAGLAMGVVMVSRVATHDVAQRRGGASAPVAGYRVLKIFPHDLQAFTQGLLFHDGYLYEGTGLVGQSSIRKVRLENGEVVQQKRTDPRYFGEGIVIFGPQLIQLTWQSEIGFVYDRATFEPGKACNYRGEGWGRAHDGKRLIM